MNHPIAQAVALVCHANAAIRGVRATPFFPGNSTCRFDEFVRFVEAPAGVFRKRPERRVASTPDAWFEHLRRTSARRVRLTRQAENRRDFPDRLLAGLVGGGGCWWILVESNDGTCSRWLAHHEVGDRDAKDQRIWRVTYEMRGRARPPRPAGAHDAVDAARKRLTGTSEAILAFSKSHADGAFADSFEKALATLRTGARHGYHRDLAPEGALPPAAADLLDACQSAWVFGGMGSWNDLGFDGDGGREFTRVTDDHFLAVCDAIAAGANASASA